jgi:hypothetical protein
MIEQGQRQRAGLEPRQRPTQRSTRRAAPLPPCRDCFDILGRRVLDREIGANVAGRSTFIEIDRRDWRCLHVSGLVCPAGRSVVPGCGRR